MLVEPNFDEIQEDVTPGEYAVRITGADVDKWEKDGRVTHFVKWTLETTGEQEAKNNGRKIFDRTALNGKGAFRLKNLYVAATGESPSGQFDTEMLLGRELKVVVDKDAKGYLNVKSYKRIQ